MITFRDRNTRGHTQTGWLDSQHSFSFGDYRDPAHMGFRSLRVLNEDRVIPGSGFATHAHRDMEIITYVLSGALEHRDSLGNGAVIRPGDIQRMSAGTGITHSEFNPSTLEPVHFLQIWIVPHLKGLPPSYEQKALADAALHNRLTLIAGPGEPDGAVSLHQDARMYAGRITAGSGVDYNLAAGRGAWLQIARGIIALNQTEMREGDGAAITQESQFRIEADTDAEILLFDLGPDAT
jgi:quercetin 2,3-dioxygenase